ncbi:N-ethylammeline chlorohydrolase [Novimethylophilus kurashikiensis]|uniref:N-ethylammeline chlorohydrolase n=1 Tax=Novimethylophilus kurashikiensis TaxID=1825523 RepID=A0A2R5F9X3_9PROT|nr:N-ethylammeline chlorohydrolase [Novimethylophilus kurashikiensis]
MAILGWAVLGLILLCVGAVLGVLGVNCLGVYNIGGVPNSWVKRGSYLLACVVFAGFAFAWASHAPFTVTFH